MASGARNGGSKAEGKTPRIRWGRAALKSLLALSIFVVFSGLIVYAYNKGKEAGGGGKPPIIQAGPAPYKVKPDRPGGMQVANRDKGVYSTIDGGKPPDVVERLLPPAETPMAPSVVPTPRAPAPLAARPRASTLTPPESTTERADPPARRPAMKPPAAKPKPVARPESEPVAMRNAERLSKIAPASGGDYKIQIAALRSTEAVNRSWKRLVRRNRDLLGGLRLDVVRRDLGSGKGVYYRMQAGPLPDRVAARDLCSRLKRRKIGCLVVRP